MGDLARGSLLRVAADHRPVDDVDEYWHSPFTVLFNLTGQPAIVLPLARCDATPERTAARFPISVQLVARYRDEATLFRLFAQLLLRRDVTHS